MPRSLCLSFDVDWAPDFVIDHVSELCVAGGAKSTWFVTHASAATERLGHHKNLIELGLHPNFMAGSTHGSTSDEVIAHCRGLVPGAVSIRTHGVFQSGPLLAQLVEKAGVKIDSSILLPEMPHIRPVRLPTPAGWLMRVPCFWADDYHLLKAEDDWSLSRYQDMPGLQTYVFHPIHVYLNSISPRQYDRVRTVIPDLSSASRRDLAPFVNKSSESGIAVMLRRLLAELKAQGGGLQIRDFLSDQST